MSLALSLYYSSAMTQIRSTFLILSLSAILFASNVVFAQAGKSLDNSASAWLEKALGGPRIYNVDEGTSVLGWLESLTVRLRPDIQKHPEKMDKTHLILGDAHHWIGHIYEDRGDLEKAWNHYSKSYFHYSQSPVEHSVLISNLKTRDHGKMHLVQTGQKLKKRLSAELRAYAERNIETGREIEDCLAMYRDELKAAQERTNEVRASNPSALTCSDVLN